MSSARKQLVPRGTRFVGMRFNPAMVRAADLGWKTQTRRVMTQSNSTIDRGAFVFSQIDFSSGRPSRAYPVSELRCRAVTASGERRSVSVVPRILPNAVLWPRRGQSGPGAMRKNAPFFLPVVSVAAVRLNDITEEDALAEGIEIFDPNARLGSQARLDAVYAFQLAQLGKMRAAKWRAGAVHQEMVARGRSCARDCFALLWESINGPGSWQKNPWVWAYKFRLMRGLSTDAPSVTTENLAPAGRGGAA